MAKVISLAEAVDMIPDGATIMFGGFMGCGSAHNIVDALSKSGKGNFTIIANDCGMSVGPYGDIYGIAKLVENKQVKHVVATHVGTCPQVAQQTMIDKTLDVSLIPQGSLVEMIRAGGAGLGGVLTPTGVGTLVEESPFCLGRQTIDGKDYLLMKPVLADFAVISGYLVEQKGNVWYKGTTRNFNPAMATAGKIVICEADHLVDIGTITPEDVVTPGPLVDYIVDGGKL